MIPWWGWAILAALLGLAEMHAPGCYLIWIALGAALTAAVLGFPLNVMPARQEVDRSMWFRRGEAAGESASDALVSVALH
jgi:predicted membrane protein